MSIYKATVPASLEMNIGSNGKGLQSLLAGLPSGCPGYK